MTEERKDRGGSRRGFLRAAAAGAAGWTLGQNLPACETDQPQPASGRQTVRDKFWIWTVFAGGDNKGWGLPKPSRITPAEAAYYLGVPNLFMIRSHGKPAIAEFDQWAIALRPLKRVAWSITGAGGKTSLEERKQALRLAQRFPNITDFIMDDFFRPDGSGALSPEELEGLKKQLVINGRKHDLYVVVYQRQLELPLAGHLEYCDKITLWTWRSENLQNLERNLQRLEKLAPRHGILLGCYLWDYGNKSPMPLKGMKMQCRLGLRWLKQKRIEGMIFLGNTVCDLGLESVEWTRKWIAEVGDQPIETPGM